MCPAASSADAAPPSIPAPTACSSAPSSHVADLVVEQLTVGVGRVPEIVSEPLLAVGELAREPRVEGLVAGLLAGGGAPAGARPRALRRRPALVEDVPHTAVVQAVLRLKE